MKQPTRTLAGIALVGLGLTASAPAMAQANPYYVGASQAFTRDTNVFRTPNGTELTDTISTTSLLAGFNQPVSRQRFFADAAVRYNRYRDNGQLDYTGYGLAIGWDWETAESLSGTLSYSDYETQSSFANNVGTAITTEANLERSQEFVARGRFGGTSLLALEALYTYRNREYSAESFAAEEFQQNSLSLGLQYRPNELLTLGAALRGTKGRYPYALGSPGAFQADEYDRSDFNLTAIWTPTGLSKLAARLSYSDESHDQIKTRDFSGVTYALAWEYRPTGKLLFTTNLLRDSGAEASFNGLSFSDPTPTGNDASLSTAIQVRGQYEATAKIRLNGFARYEERNLIPTGSDKTGQLTLGIDYAPARNWLLGCSAGYEKRGGETPDYYTAHVYFCGARFVLQ